MDITAVMTLGFGAIGAVLWYIIGKIDSLDKKLDDKISSLNKKLDDRTELMDGKISSLDDKISDIKDKLFSLETDFNKKISDIKDWLLNFETDFSRLEMAFCTCVPGAKSVYTFRHSPVCLSEKGLEIVRLLNGEAMIDAHAAALTEKMNPAKLGNAYDIEKEAFTVVMTEFYRMLTPEETEKLKDVAFRKGENIEAFLVIFQILFRDKVLLSKGIDINKYTTDSESQESEISA